MGSTLELQELLTKKEDRIKQLEAKIKLKDDEIIELKSQLDKFQSVMPFAGGKQQVAGKRMARKERAQGISAEPQTVKTIQELAELSQTTFTEVPKSERYVNEIFENIAGPTIPLLGTSLIYLQRCSMFYLPQLIVMLSLILFLRILSKFISGFNNTQSYL